jgi:catechol 2,3-dioxygenase-like lactoylglutathione lyase family enzyme
VVTIKVGGLDHVVLNVADVERSLAWYTEELGLKGERVDEWRTNEAPFPSVRVDASTIIDLVVGERTGENVHHVCLVIDPTDLDEVVASERFNVLQGPVPRWGAQGWAQSIYIRDPDGNVIELRHYG